MTNRPIAQGITIDGPYSKDLDDAIWLDKLDDGWCLYVSIADVAAHVAPESSMDAEAFKRASTVYLANNRNRSMLPRPLSEHKASLLPGQQRQAITFSIPINQNLEPGNIQIRQTTLTSTAKMSYEEVDSAICNNEHEHHPMLQQCNALAQMLLRNRQKKGALAIYDIDRGVMTTEEGQVVYISSDKAYLSNIIIQEFMILTNQATAAFFAERDFPILFRNHTVKTVAPNREEILHDIQNSVMNPQDFSIDVIRKRLNLVMNRASCGPELAGHYGLNLPAYAYFTSPIRRYVDLVNHRILSAFLNGKNPPYDMEHLKQIAAHLNERENKIKDAKGEALKAKAVRAATHAIDRDKFLDLDNTQFLQILKVAIREERMTPELQDAITARIRGGKFTIRAFACLFFEKKQSAEVWRKLQQEALDWLVEHSEQSVSILNVGQQIHGVGEPLYESMMQGEAHQPRFTATAEVIVNGASFVSDEWEASSKKNAQQYASVNLIGKIVGIPVPFQKPEEPERPAPPHEGPMPTQKAMEERLAQQRSPVTGTTTLPVAISARQDTDDEVQNILESDNPKGDLIALCQRNKWKQPKYILGQMQESRRTLSVMTAKVVAFGQEYTSAPCKAPNKKIGERHASADLLQKLMPMVASGEIPTGGKGSKYINPISALQEFCQKNKHLMPEYKFPEFVDPHMMSITCTCSVRMGETSLQGVGEGRNKKDAKTDAATMVLAKIQESGLAPPAE